MPSTTKISLRLLVLPLFFALPLHAQQPGFGWVSGNARAVHRIHAPGAPKPPAYANDGFIQSVTGSDGDWTVTVEVNPKALKVRAPFRPKALPGASLPQDLAAPLASALSRCQRTDEAVNAVLLFLKCRFKYLEKPAFSETFAEVASRRAASCVGLTRAAVAILSGLGIPCREVVGFRAPPLPGPTKIEGGRLHAWIEVDYPGTGSVFCDVLRSSGWVGPDYVVLRRGEGLDVGGLAAYGGGTFECTERSDRIFFEPASKTLCVLWARPSVSAFTGNILTGKLLGPTDSPVEGQVRLSGPGDSVAMDLWDGNFFFRDLEPGQYELLLSPKGAASQRTSVALDVMDKRHLVFYLTGGHIKPSG